MPVLQHLCNTFNNCVRYCLRTPRHNNIASKALRSKTLPYQPHVYGAEEDKMTKSKSDNAISWQILVHIGMLKIVSICISWLFIVKFKHLARLLCVQVVVKGVAPHIVGLHQPMPNEILHDRQWIDPHLAC